MLKASHQMELSSFKGIYERLIPQNHMLRQFNNLVDFSFIYDELKTKYFQDNGRNGISPIILFKCLLLSEFGFKGSFLFVDNSGFIL